MASEGPERLPVAFSGGWPCELAGLSELGGPGTRLEHRVPAETGCEARLDRCLISRVAAFNEAQAVSQRLGGARPLEAR